MTNGNDLSTEQREKWKKLNFYQAGKMVNVAREMGKVETRQNLLSFFVNIENAKQTKIKFTWLESRPRPRKWAL